MRPRSPPAIYLSQRSFWMVTAAVVALFLIIDNPIFGDPYQIDRSIAVSYLAIPPLTGFFLLLEKRLSFVSLVLESLVVACVKFGITFMIAIVMWTLFDPVDPPAAVMEPSRRSPQSRKTVPTQEPVVVVTPKDAAAADQAMVTVSAGEPFALKSPDDGLHTAMATRRDGRILFNVPLLPGSQGRVVTLTSPGEVVEIKCTVHGDAERYPLIRVIE